MKKNAFVALLCGIFICLGCAEPESLDINIPDINTPKTDDSKTPKPSKDNGSEKKCNHECESGSECTDSNHYRKCEKDENKCYHWSDTLECPEDETCNDGKCFPEIPGCSDTCDGDKKCVSDNEYQLCSDLDNNGCKEWSQNISCPENEICQNGECKLPVGFCTDECSNTNDHQCAGDNLQTCGNYDEDSCLEWGNDTPCEYGCANNECKDWVPECKTQICPIPITDFSKPVSGDTSKSQNIISNYPSCTDFNKTSVANEGGPEDYYVIQTSEPGYLVVGVSVASSKVDVDVHILTDLDGNKCLARGDVGAGATVDAGIYYITADTFVNGDDSSAKAGAYELKVTFFPDSGKCGMKHSVMKRRSGCSDVTMPSTAPIATEAHLVTDHDREMYDNGSSLWWPANQQEHIDTHKAYTDQLFGEGTSSGGEWCPSEGGHIGSGSSGKFVPADAEAWYINMNWDSSTKPAKGTRYLVVEPTTGKTVVAAAGYETGPGSCARMGGAVYEIRKYTKTDHGDVMTFGELQTQDLKFGPIDCFDNP